MTTFDEALEQILEEIEELSLHPVIQQFNELTKKLSILLQARAILEGDEVESSASAQKPKGPTFKKIQKGSIAQKILEALKTYGPQSREAIQEALDISPKNFWRVMKEFEGSYFVREGDGSWAAKGFTRAEIEAAQPPSSDEAGELEFSPAPKAPPVEDEELIRIE